MKTRLLTALFALLISSSTGSFIYAASTTPAGGEPEVEIVVSQKKIWFVAGESPVKKLDVRILNEKGCIILQKQLSSKMTDWWIDVRELPSGTYRIMLDSVLSKTFTRKEVGV